jgi:hypothetical protein
VRRRSSMLKKEIERVLSACAPSVRRTPGGAWRLGLDTDGEPDIEATMLDGWLFFHAPLYSGAPAHGLWQLLRADTLMAGRCKIVLEPDGRSMRLREDVPLIDGRDPSDDCRHAAFNLSEAARALPIHLAAAANHSASNRPGETVARSRGTHENDVLGEACAAAGWKYSRRPDGRLIVDLDATGIFHQAVLESPLGSPRRAYVQLAHYRAPADDTRESAALFMLTMNGSLRLARAAIEETEKGANASYEVPLFGEPSAAIINEALSALSVTCRFCSRELRALGNEKLSRIFLDVRGWRPASKRLRHPGDAGTEHRRRKEVRTCSRTKAPGSHSKSVTSRSRR